MNKPHHRIALAAAILYLVAVALIVFWPSPVDRPASGQLRTILLWLHQHGVPEFIGYNKVEFAANIVMFVPMGCIAATWFKKAWAGVLVGALASCMIELGQAMFMPARFATVLDVLANTAGAALGAVIYYVAHRRWRAEQPLPSTHTVREVER